MSAIERQATLPSHRPTPVTTQQQRGALTHTHSHMGPSCDRRRNTVIVGTHEVAQSCIRRSSTADASHLASPRVGRVYVFVTIVGGEFVLLGGLFMMRGAQLCTMDHTEQLTTRYSATRAGRCSPKLQAILATIEATAARRASTENVRYLWRHAVMSAPARAKKKRRKAVV
ncbi:hypothetical protein WOLCODRAFT_166792 [Wolfiporia cocos MD-104 SS10]|uniref:Uncharacterized protein n=1 Tax=Wolfiporia cocos (strain MD-104) TaxID=742152 RepID=A0A2H3J200_WOLCO|nr:hypothetical protein WOLCODRAFT_166792 [Wolfiporia cocos MD-104 SS10]